MIYFWNDKQLARDLKAGSVTEKDKFIYLLLYLFVPAAFKAIGSMFQQHPEQAVLASRFGWVGLLLIPVGVWVFCLFYKLNTQGDGAHFIERFICLSFPLGIRLLVIMISGGLLIVLAGILLTLIFGRSELLAIAAVLSVIILAFWYYLTRLLTLFKIASGQME